MTNLSERIAHLSPAKRALLEKRLLQQVSTAPDRERIARRTTGAPAPLSFGQQRLWFLDQLEPQSAVFNLPAAKHLSGVLDVDALQRAFATIVARHEVLRTVFATQDGKPVQVVSEQPITLPLDDLSALPSGEREAQVEQLIADEALRPFDLAHDLKTRLRLVRLAADEHLLIRVAHHIASDAWSARIFDQELMACYRAYALGETPALPDLPIQYGDYAHWQREKFHDAALREPLAYWQRQLDGAPASLDLSSDRPRPAVQTHHGARLSTTLSAPFTDALKAFSRSEDVTLFMTLLAAFQTLLKRYTEQDDVTVGTPTAGRNHIETENLIGFFVNTLVLRTDLSGDPTFREALQRVREVALGAFAHQDVPFEKLVEALQPERDLSRSPLFQVMFQLRQIPRERFALPGLSVAEHEFAWHTAQFDLSLDIIEADGELTCVCEYNTDLFERATIERLLAHFQMLLADALAYPDKRLSALRLLNEREEHQLLVAWNDTEAEFPHERCLHELFEDQVARTPDATALLFKDERITYRALNARANQLAHHLQHLGVAPGVAVGVCLERSIEMVVGLLAILKAGGAYLPLDPTYPRERMAFMLRDAAPSVLLTKHKHAERLPAHDGATVYLDSDRELLNQYSTETRVLAVQPTDPAYVIYTSGSTGEPKGVVGLHQGAVNRCAWMWAAYPFADGELCCQKTSLNFVEAVWEIFGSLLRGVPLVIVPDAAVKDPHQFVDLLAAQQVTRIVLVPSLLRALLESDAALAARLPQLKLWISSGEALSLELCQQFAQAMPDRTLLNLYGSSEVSADATCYDTRTLPADARSVPIGRPLANTQVFVLDAQRQPVPIGVPGELYVGGVGLAGGYLNRRELTLAKFVPSPFARGALLYATGDRARWLPDGNLEFLGRADHLVKVRGFRIELGEIEAVLRRHPAVQQAVVVSRGGADDVRLVAYVVPQTPLTAETLRAHAQQYLPDHMLPAQYVLLDKLPLLPNGKVDRCALPANAPRVDVKTESAAPRDHVEQHLVEIWEQILGVQPIGIHDNFFELGGHSLLAIRVFAQIEKQLGRRLPLAALFQSPTIAGIGALLRQHDSAAHWSVLVPIQPHGTLPPFFCVHGFGGGVVGYAELARLLGPDQPFYGLQARGLDGVEATHGDIREMAAYYVEAMRALQPHGPYYVGGYCFGGVVAFEMARQLRALGEPVARVALFEGYAPNRARAGEPWWSVRGALNFWRNVPYWLRDYWQLGYRQMGTQLARKTRLSLKKLRGRLGAPTRVKPEDVIGDVSYIPHHHRKLMETHIRAMQQYVPQVYDGRLTLFRVQSQSLFRAADPLKGWGKLTSAGVEVRLIAGTHHNILATPHVQSLARELQTSLAQARTNGNGHL